MAPNGGSVAMDSEGILHNYDFCWSIAVTVPGLSWMLSTMRPSTPLSNEEDTEAWTGLQ